MVNFKVQAKCLVAAAYIAVAAAAVCSSDLLVDDFTNSFTTHRNNLDDGSMASMSASGGILSFTPKSGAYYYETFPCQALQTDSYSHIQFDIKAPASGAAMTATLKWASSCSVTTGTKTSFRVTGLTGAWQNLRIPLTSFSGANLNAALSLIIESFSLNQQWQLDKIHYFVYPSNVQHAVVNGHHSHVGHVGVYCRYYDVDYFNANHFHHLYTYLVYKYFDAAHHRDAIHHGCIHYNIVRCDHIGLDRIQYYDICPNIIHGSYIYFAGIYGNFHNNALYNDHVLGDPSRIDFLGYNALLLPTGDDDTMKSMIVDNYHITLTPKSLSSYFYSQVGCVDGTKYGGIALRIQAQAGTTFKIELSSKTTCGGEATAWSSRTTAQLGWTFDGTEKLYSLTFSQFSGLSVTRLRSFVLEAPSHPVTLGPLAFYCGTTPSSWPVPSTTSGAPPTETVSAPTGTASAFVIDTFSNKNTNSLGFWHGGGDLSLTWGTNRVTIVASLPDYAFTTQLSNGCKDLRSASGSYLHIAFTGHTKFSVALQQHNSQCSEGVAPFPETRDTVQAGRYASSSGIYIPISHFNINLQRVSSVAIRSIYTTESLVLTKIEIVPSVPGGVTIPPKLPSGTLVFACTRPNSFAFGIDDGNPRYAAALAQIIRDAGIKGLPDIASIDWEYNENFRVMNNVFGQGSSYFRPPFGVDGARMRERWAAISGAQKPYVVNWDVDVEDWLWAESSTPEKQVDSFKADVAKGGNLVVMHYSYNSTVNYFPEFIREAKAAGKQIMRVDQCMEDPNAPPL
ncbi:Chitin deacetylase-like protein 10 [Purpureocillium lavendulum]|uniref:Chitin deacetylase-like protein 10 n=1 Tax=Purpureocillium lavendulum TaxID=1247861 RepID=A0AB34FSS4_9HYPO|nr:Chitin deacetylase-like protein 10 [Purpureocillium lavendulum]